MYTQNCFARYLVSILEIPENRFGGAVRPKPDNGEGVSIH